MAQNILKQCPQKGHFFWLIIMALNVLTRILPSHFSRILKVFADSRENQSIVIFQDFREIEIRC